MNINVFPTFRGKHSENLIIHLIDQISNVSQNGEDILGPYLNFHER